MKIKQDSVKVQIDSSNKIVTQFTIEDGSVWQRDDKGIYKELSPNFATLQAELDIKLGVEVVEKPYRYRGSSDNIIKAID
jgi:hypothetical protein